MCLEVTLFVHHLQGDKAARCRAVPAGTRMGGRGGRTWRRAPLGSCPSSSCCAWPRGSSSALGRTASSRTALSGSGGGTLCEQGLWDLESIEADLVQKK